jgi:hypothetical protein
MRYAAPCMYAQSAVAEAEVANPFRKDGRHTYAIFGSAGGLLVSPSPLPRGVRPVTLRDNRAAKQGELAGERGLQLFGLLG